MVVRREVSNGYLKLTAQMLTRMPIPVSYPGTPHARHGGDPQTTPILTTSYCQDPSSAVQIRKVL